MAVTGSQTANFLVVKLGVVRLTHENPIHFENPVQGKKLYVHIITCAVPCPPPGPDSSLQREVEVLEKISMAQHGACKFHT